MSNKKKWYNGKIKLSNSKTWLQLRSTATQIFNTIYIAYNNKTYLYDNCLAKSNKEKSEISTNLLPE